MDAVVHADLNQVPVGVAEVQRADRPQHADAVDWTLLDGYIRVRKCGLDGLQRHGGDEAEVGRSRGRPQGLGIELATDLMEIELLFANSGSLGIDVVRVGGGVACVVRVGVGE